MAYLDENGLAYFKGKLDQITDKLNDQITETDTALDNLTSLIERDTASGSIVEVNAEYAAPVEKLVVNIEPQQDLHGYDNPWPAGGGKNKLPLNLADIKSITTYGSWSGNKYTFRGITWTIDIDDAGNVVGITANGTAEQETNISIVLPFDIDGSYSLSGCPTGGDGYSTYNVRILNESTNEVIASDYGNGSTFTTTNRVKARITIYAGYTASNLKFYPMLRLSSIADPTFAPYSSICPISGWTGAEIEQRGKNLFDNAMQVYTRYQRDTGDGKYYWSYYDDSKSYAIPVLPNTTYTLSGYSSQSSFFRLGVIHSQLPSGNEDVQMFNVVRETSIEGFGTTRTYTTDSEATYLIVQFGSNVIDYFTEHGQLELGSTATDYEEYRGSQISVTFPSSAGTVYGGTLTLNPDRTGALVVDMTTEALVWGNGYAAADLNGITRKGFSLQQTINASKIQSSKTNIAPLSTTEWAESTVHFDIGGASGRQAFVWLPTETTSETTITLTYPIATPVTYQLTASEVSGILSTIRGTNYIWANTGDIAELKYQSGGFATTNTATKMIEKSAGTKADVITETASGSIVSFSDGADNLPVKSLVVNIEPQQDLHGYDSPWPAGGGKNLVDPTLSPISTKRVSSVTVVNGDNEITLTTTADVNYMCLGIFYRFKAGTYTIKYQATSSDAYAPSISIYSGSTLLLGLISPDTARTFSIAEDSNIEFRMFASGNGNGVVGRTVRFYNMQVEAGSAATTWTPYSNICPISGWTGAEIADTAINIWDEEWEVGGLNGSSGAFWNTTDRIRSKNFIPVKPDTEYYLKYPVSGINVDIIFYDSSKAFVSSTNGVNKAITTPSNAYYVKFASYAQYGPTYNHDISINYPSTDTEYHPYTGNQISVTFPSSAGTVYGGMLTINPDRTGTLAVDRAMVEYDGSSDEQWGEYGNDSDSYCCTSYPSGKETGYQKSICNEFENVDNAFASADYGIYSDHPTYRNTYFRMPNADVNTKSEFLAWITQHPIQLVYELATPVTYQLTSTEISAILTALYGTNNIWSDAGDITVEYPVDTKLYIQQLTKPTEDDMTADNAIAAGTFFMIGNTLYLATSQIAAGATITPGTNATKLSLADALNQLNS